MIIKGYQRGAGRALAKHLANTRDNEHVDVIELRGFLSNDLKGAFLEVEAAATATKCKQPFFSVSLNPPEGYAATDEQFRQAADLIEDKIPGLKGQPRCMTIHEKNGRRHAHVTWSRITERSTAVQLSHSWAKLKDVSKAMYAAMQREAPAGIRHRSKADPLNYDLSTWQQAKRMGEDPRDLKQTVQQAWASSDDRVTFEHALAQADLYLARGDKRGFVIVHPSGEVMSLTRYGGLSTRDLKARLGPPEQLRSVEQTKALMKQGPPAASIERDRALRERQREELRPHEDERQRMTKAQRKERRSLDRRHPGKDGERQRTIDGHLRERGQLQDRIRQTSHRHRAERQRDREQRRIPLSTVERQQALFDVWANARRADLQNRRHGAEGEQGRGHDRQRIKLERQQHSTYGQQLKALKAEAAAIATRQRQGAKPLRGLAYRVTGRAGRDRDRADEIKASIGSIEQRKAEQFQALNAEQQADSAELAGRFIAQAAQLEKRIQQRRTAREAEGWIPPEAREATTGQQIETAAEAENLPVEGRESGTGETPPENEQATHAQPESTREANSTEAQEPKQWTDEERAARIEAEYERQAQAGRERGSNDNGRGREIE